LIFFVSVGDAFTACLYAVNALPVVVVVVVVVVGALHESGDSICSRLCTRLVTQRLTA